MRYILFILLGWSYGSYFSAEIDYEVSMTAPHTHYFEVKMRVVGHEKDYFDVQMPVWAPGSYLVREFSKNVEGLSVLSNGNEIGAEKVNKNTWRIYSKGADNVTISYKVYAFEMSVRTSFMDASHAYFNGSSMFMYIEELKNNPVSLRILPHSSWKKVTTSLPKKEGSGFNYTAENYDILVDSPVEIGNQETFDFTSAGVHHHVAMYGEGNYDIEKLKVDMAKIAQAATDVFGVNPNKEYTFIIHNLTRGSGGLEHLNSTTLQVNRWTYEGDKYKKFLGLVAHEYFHLWNVKRIRPASLGPFDYDNENYTSLLWVMEGFTSYYDRLLLYRASIYTKNELFSKLASSINAIEKQPGNKVQTVADASFNAWIKAYRPNENSYNTTISYYTKGVVIANMLDLTIVNETGGKKNLDDVMRHLYQEFYLKQGRGFTDEEMKNTLEQVAGIDLTEFYKKYINGTTTFDYKAIFGYANLSVEEEVDKSPYLGVSLSDSKITRVNRNSSAYDAGLNVKDELIFIDTYRVKDNVSEFIAQKNVGDTLSVVVSRDNIMQTISVPLKADNRISYSISDEGKKENSVLKKWLTKE